MMVGEKGGEREQLRRMRDKLWSPAMLLDLGKSLAMIQLDRLSRDTKQPGE